MKTQRQKGISLSWEPTRTLPGRLVNIEARKRRFKVAWVCEAMRPEGAEVRQLELRTKDLLNVWFRRFSSSNTLEVLPDGTYIHGRDHLGV